MITGRVNPSIVSNASIPTNPTSTFENSEETTIVDVVTSLSIFGSR
jgi:hypothetical protein